MKKLLSLTLPLFMALAISLPWSTVSASNLSGPDKGVAAQVSPVRGTGTVIEVGSDSDDGVVTLTFDYYVYSYDEDVIVVEGDTGGAAINWQTDNPALQEMLQATDTELQGLGGSGDNNTLMVDDAVDIRVRAADEGFIDVTLDVSREGSAVATFSFVTEGDMAAIEEWEGAMAEEDEQILSGSVLDSHQFYGDILPVLGGDNVEIRAKELGDGGVEFTFDFYRDNHIVSTFTMVVYEGPLAETNEDDTAPSRPISFQSVNYPERYIVADADHAAIQLLPLTGASTNEQKKLAEFIVVPGLVDDSLVSLQVNDGSGGFLAASPEGVVIVNPDRIGDFLEEATFNAVDGLVGIGVSFESVAYPEHFLRHSSFVLQLNTFDETDLFLEDASFNDVNALSTLKPAKGTLQLVSTAVGDTPDDGSIQMHDDVSVELIMDASNSMSGDRIATAKETLSELVLDVLPDGIPVALRVFGHLEENGNYCTSNLEVPLGPLDRDLLSSTINSMDALGNTAIAASLAEVQEDLADAEGSRLVVLVTDGDETCNGDPLGAISALSDAGIDVRVNIVGFAIDDNPTLKQKFEEWAAAGNGRYFNAASGDDLGEAIKQALSVHYVVWDASGNEVAFGVVDGPAIDLVEGDYTIELLNHQEETLDVTVTGNDATVIDIER
ncbi:MAG: AbfB domain-containing protein [Chloroflexota bacterium]